jgi:hypothetical protein
MAAKNLTLEGTGRLPCNISFLCFVAVGLLLLGETAFGRDSATNQRSELQVGGEATTLDQRADSQFRERPQWKRVTPSFSLARMHADTRACVTAIAASEAQYGIPAGLLQAIAKVESGRASPTTGELEPWPWSINVSNQGMYFSSLGQAVEYVRRDQAKGKTSIDVGCLQVNLQQHPAAFATLIDAFNPVRNTDYAARFLVQLRMKTGDWTQAVGLYHSGTPALAVPYRTKVERIWTTSGGRMQRRPVDPLQAAWASTLQDGTRPGRSAWKPQDMLAASQGSLATAEGRNRRKLIRLAGPLASAD